MDFDSAVTWHVSYASTVAFSPISNKVNESAANAKSESRARVTHLLQYFAKPIDGIINAIAILVFAAIDHFRGLAVGSKKEITAKIALSVVTLPVKICLAVFATAGFLFNGLIEIALPWSTVVSLIQGKRAAHRFFYNVNQYRESCKSLKPIEVMPVKQDINLNLIHQEEQKLVAEFNAVKPTYEAALEKLKRLKEQQKQCSKDTSAFSDYCIANPNDSSSTAFLDLKSKMIAAETVRKESEAAQSAFEKAKKEFEKVQNNERRIIHLTDFSTMNNAIPILLNFFKSEAH